MELPIPGRRLAIAIVIAGSGLIGTAACSAPVTHATAANAAAPAAPSMDPGMAMGTAAATAPSATVTIHIRGFAYSDPGPVAPGTRMTLMNMDSEAHTLTADDGSFTVTAPAGQSVAFTAPTTPGTYAFHCQYHATMHGTLIVD